MDFDFRLKVFHTAATQLNFTKTAAALYISQPAVSKNILELEKNIGVSLFERKGNNLILTKAGEILSRYAEQIIQLYHKADQEIFDLQSNLKGHLTLGASTTISQYIIPSLLAKFLNDYPSSHIEVAQYNSRTIEELLIDKKIDLGITEGATDNRALKYIPFMKDELVLVTNNKNPSLDKLKNIEISYLYQIPLVLREIGSGTRSIIENKLKSFGVDFSRLNIEMVLGSTESIKRYIQERNCFAFLSIHAIQKEILEDRLSIVDISDLQIERYFYFTHAYGGLTGVPNQFMQFCMRQLT